jgi:hypothetical protein
MGQGPGSPSGRSARPRGLETRLYETAPACRRGASHGRRGRRAGWSPGRRGSWRSSRACRRRGSPALRRPCGRCARRVYCPPLRVIRAPRLAGIVAQVAVAHAGRGPVGRLWWEGLAVGLTAGAVAVAGLRRAGLDGLGLTMGPQSSAATAPNRRLGMRRPRPGSLACSVCDTPDLPLGGRHTQSRHDRWRYRMTTSKPRSSDTASGNVKIAPLIVFAVGSMA